MLDCCCPPALSDRDLPAAALRSCRRSPPTLGFHQLVHPHCSFPDTVKRDGTAVLSLPAAFSGFPNRFKEITIDPQRDVWCLLIRVLLFLCFLPLFAHCSKAGLPPAYPWSSRVLHPPRPAPHPCPAQQPGWTRTGALRGSRALPTVWQSDPACLSELESKSV